ncbi:hypothetical protein FSOLCH5_011535 [Fusarium solani]
MAPVFVEYSMDEGIAEFFSKTTSSQAECNNRAQELVGGSLVPVAVQGVCSYSVYAGPNLEFVVQFRLKWLELKIETSALARRILGEYAPDVTFKDQLGDDSDTDGKEPLLVYVMSRIRAVSHLDFVLSHSIPSNSPEFFALRKTLMTDIARFFARSWNHPQEVDSAFRDGLRQRFESELRLLFSLPERFHPIIRSLQGSLPAILSLPMVLVHKDFGVCNILVDDATFNLVGVIDWAEAEIGPFGTNLHSLQPLTGHLHLKDGWARYDDYEDLQDTF